MKTTKITLITALIALGAILFGQADQVQYINTSYAEKSCRFENLVSNYLSMTDRAERNGYKEPVVYMSYMVNQADVVYEENYETEAWMTTPFESSVDESDLNVEAWMTAPFKAGDHIEIESWMTAAF